MTKVKSLVSLALILNPVFAFAINITCISTFTSLETFVDCLDKHTVTEGFYTFETYTTAQPSGPAEITAWTNAVNSMLTVGCPGTAVTVVPGLNGDYVVARVTDSISFGKSWCVLVETRTFNDTTLAYKRGWGFVITPHETVTPATRHLHFSAPHPRTDGNTPRQATALFERTEAKSLVVTGRHRVAYATATHCSEAIPPGTYYMTDSSHGNNEPFYHAVSQVAAWQDAHGGCPWAFCAYVQMHGKSGDPAKPSCPEYDVFMSSGLGNSVNSEACYSNALLPITRLKNALITTFSEYDIGTPTENGTCHLTATRNVFGRLVSGIDASDVCVNSGTVRRVIPCTCLPSRGCMGKFVHVEQDPDLLLPTNYGRWAEAFKAVFPSSPLKATEELEANVFRVQS